MKTLLNSLDIQSLELIKGIGSLAQELGVKAYLVGGPVRDLMLKRPVLDLDIVVEGAGIKLAQKFSDCQEKSQVVTYPAFKTATVQLMDGRMVDFATARCERYPYPGSFPAVTPSGIKDDLYRRDFTINALAISINPRTLGRLVDPWGGLKDLKAKRIRILHEKSFTDDPTRILRAARFKARLRFTVERQTIKLLRSAVGNGALSTIKPQRYMKEFNKILKEKNKAEALKCLKEWKALRREHDTD